MTRPRLTYANVVSTLCLFIVLGGSSYAAVALKNNSVRSKHIKNGQVTRADLRSNAVSSAKVGDRSLLARDFAPGQIPQGPKGDKGAPGAAGATNVRTRLGQSCTVTGPRNEFTNPYCFELPAFCADGERATGGGIAPTSSSLSTGAPADAHAFLSRPGVKDGNSIFPRPPTEGEAPNAWVATMRANVPANATFTYQSYVVCAAP